MAGCIRRENQITDGSLKAMAGCIKQENQITDGSLGVADQSNSLDRKIKSPMMQMQAPPHERGRNLSKWNTAALVVWMKENNLTKLATVFEDEEIDGEMLVHMNRSQLDEYGGCCRPAKIESAWRKFELLRQTHAN